MANIPVVTQINNLKIFILGKIMLESELIPDTLVQIGSRDRFLADGTAELDGEQGRGKIETHTFQMYIKKMINGLNHHFTIVFDDDPLNTHIINGTTKNLRRMAGPLQQNFMLSITDIGTHGALYNRNVGNIILVNNLLVRLTRKENLDNNRFNFYCSFIFPSDVANLTIDQEYQINIIEYELFNNNNFHYTLKEFRKNNPGDLDKKVEIPIKIIFNGDNNDIFTYPNLEHPNYTQFDQIFRNEIATFHDEINVAHNDIQALINDAHLFLNTYFPIIKTYLYLDLLTKKGFYNFFAKDITLYMNNNILIDNLNFGGTNPNRQERNKIKKSNEIINDINKLIDYLIIKEEKGRRRDDRKTLDYYWNCDNTKTNRYFINYDLNANNKLSGDYCNKMFFGNYETYLGQFNNIERNLNILINYLIENQDQIPNQISDLEIRDLLMNYNQDRDEIKVKNYLLSDISRFDNNIVKCIRNPYIMGNEGYNNRCNLIMGSRYKCYKDNQNCAPINYVPNHVEPFNLELNMYQYFKTIHNFVIRKQMIDN